MKFYDPDFQKPVDVDWKALPANQINADYQPIRAWQHQFESRPKSGSTNVKGHEISWNFTTHFNVMTQLSFKQNDDNANYHGA